MMNDIDDNAIGEMRESGVVWFKGNPHSFPVGTRFYTQSYNSTNFKKEDVEAIAKALIENGLTEHDTDVCCYSHVSISCPCCGVEEMCNWKNTEITKYNFQHKPNCEMVIAANILEKITENKK